MDGDDRPAAVLLGALLGQDITILQGSGSVIAVHPRVDGRVEVGGMVVLDEIRPWGVSDRV
jgi:hypothetical protein